MHFDEGEAEQSSLRSNGGPVANAWQFVRGHSLKILATSAAIGIPCFWHRHIEAGDLPSHVYNAWLALLIERGQAPGMYLARQWNNILFDTLLTRLGAVAGFDAAEKILVYLSVLLFFWGAFGLIGAFSQRAPWFLTPAIAILAYGWTFQSGFNNYYVSVAFAFWSLAIFWVSTRWEHTLPGLVLIPLALFAHPLGFLLAIGGGLYVAASRLLPGWWKIAPLLAAMCVVFAGRTYLANHFEVRWAPYHFLVNGVDQISLGIPYKPLAQTVLFLGIAFFLCDMILRRKDSAHWKRLVVPVGLYAATMAAVLLLPDVIAFPQYARAFSLVAWRLTLVSAVFALCVLGCIKARIWHLLAFGATALVFFGLLWRDTSAFADWEAQVERLIAPIPNGSRVIGTLYWPVPGSRFYFVNHIVDRACVGRCFSYANYEPSTKQFRVRVLPGSTVAADTAATSDEMQGGSYVVQPKDVPVFQIAQCSSKDSTLCMRELHVGETNGYLFSKE